MGTCIVSSSVGTAGIVVLGNCVRYHLMSEVVSSRSSLWVGFSCILSLLWFELTLAVGFGSRACI